MRSVDLVGGFKDVEVQPFVPDRLGDDRRRVLDDVFTGIHWVVSFWTHFTGPQEAVVAGQCCLGDGLVGGIPDRAPEAGEVDLRLCALTVFLKVACRHPDAGCLLCFCQVVRLTGDLEVPAFGLCFGDHCLRLLFYTATGWGRLVTNHIT